MNSTHSPWCPELLAATYGLKDGALKHAKVEKNKNKNENTHEQANIKKGVKDKTQQKNKRFDDKGQRLLKRPVVESKKK